SEPLRASAADFVLEGLCALKKITRTDEGRVQAPPGTAKPRQREDARSLEDLMEDEAPVKGKKKYFN
ncbi:MAG TPA: hypothetical protein VJN96_00865, partial [Vicinamibacterales bacterium]|nr:hypothetical protein [Vicinamibacterales bacterium]